MKKFIADPIPNHPAVTMYLAPFAALPFEVCVYTSNIPLIIIGMIGMLAVVGWCIYLAANYLRGKRSKRGIGFVGCDGKPVTNAVVGVITAPIMWAFGIASFISYRAIVGPQRVAQVARPVEVSA